MIAAIVSTFAVACGDSNGGSPPPATNTAAPAATATPTQTGQAGGVSGLLVLNANVGASASDALGAPPPEWTASKDGGSFGRSLAAANWSIDGGPAAQGVSGPDGAFTAGVLSPGPHTLQVTKTLGGNLASVSVPFNAGDDGSADLVVEVSWGQAKLTNTYTHDGVEVRAVRAPNGSWLTLRDGHLYSFGDFTRTFVDPDGSGLFTVSPCIYDGASSPQPYACNADSVCAQPGDRCVCVPSCPACDDCPKSVCIPSCPPIEISAISTSGPSEVIVGQTGSMSATALLSDGGTFDVTFLADWTSSDATTATIDSWGTVSAVQVGSASITATLGTLASTPWPIKVSGRPPLRAIHVQNVSCVFPMGATGGNDGALPPTAVPAPRSDILPVPVCSQVLQVGATIQFRAVGEFDNGYYQDITDEVQWQVDPAEVGSVVAGVFTAQQAGTAALTANLDGVVSDGTTIRVVTQPTVVALSIYADNGGFAVLQGGPAPAPVAQGMPCLMDRPGMAGMGVPCCCPGPLMGSSAAPCQCNYAITVLRGDQLTFHATAQYDTGAWQDVTSQATWSSSDTSVATIDANGVMAAERGGDASIAAEFEGVTSDPASVHVVDQATLQSLYIYQEGTDRVVAKGDQRFFHASGYYDVGISRDVTTEAMWHSSDDAVGGFDSPGVFTARSAGMVQVWAELDGQKSGPASLEVYETGELGYCDPDNINRAVWSDDFNRVTLESDCASYNEPSIATLRYTVTQIQDHGGIFNPCLDLYVFAGATKVRTIREQGCGAPFAAGSAPLPATEILKYQLRAFWDLKDDSGAPVPPGTYTIYGRFYLYYDPVVSLDVTVLAPGVPTPTGRPTAPIATPTPSAPLPSIEVGSATGAPGDTVTFAVTLHRAGEVIDSMQNDLTFDPAAAVVAGASGAPACKVNSAINKEAGGFAFGPYGCSACTQMRALLLSMANFKPIPDGAVLYTCQVQIAADAAPGTYPLVPSDVIGADVGRRVPMTGTIGEIVVVAGGTPLPTSPTENTPTPTPTLPPQTTPMSSSIALSSVGGRPGEQVKFTATLQAAGGSVAGIQNDIAFDSSNIPIAVGSDGTPACAGLAANARAVFAFLPYGCAGRSCVGMRAVVYTPDTASGILDEALLYTCIVDIAPTAAPGTYPLTLSGVVIAGPSGERIMAGPGVDGSVVVDGSPLPP